MDNEEMKKMFKNLYEVMASDELGNSIATMYWNLYCKLKVKGFTEEQALIIISKFNLGNK